MHILADREHSFVRDDRSSSPEYATAVRVDLHYPKIVDNGDNICCFPNLEPGVISRMRESLRAKLEADRARKKREGKRLTGLDDDALSMLVEKVQEKLPQKNITRSRVLRAACYLDDDKLIQKLAQLLVENT